MAGTVTIPLPGGAVWRPTFGRKQVQVLVGLAVAVLVDLLVLPHLFSPENSLSHHWETPYPVVALGVITGMTYGLLGVGLVLIYRSNRIINFAHGNIGAFGAALFGLMVLKGHVPYWIALVPALAAGAGAGALSETVVIRRLRKAPPLMSIVATLGVGQFLAFFGFAINPQAGTGSLFPQPPGLPQFMVGGSRGHLVTRAEFGMLVLSPLVVAAVALFLKYSKYGLALRCAAANPEAARMTGIFAGRMSGLAWALGGSLACLGAILTLPGQGLASADSFGPSLLLRALVPAVVGRMQSMPVTLGAGIGLGVIEQVLLHNYPDSGYVEVVLFVLILIVLLVQKQVVGRDSEKGSWAAVVAARPLPVALREVWLIRNMAPVLGVAFLAVFAVLPLWVSNAHCVLLTGIFAFVCIGLSVGVITGLGGQVSLGQFAIAAVGAIVSFQTIQRTGNFFEGFLYAGLASALVSVLIGLPALRVKGLLLTVTTLSFSLVIPQYLIQQKWAFGSGASPGYPILFGHKLDTGKSYYFVGLFMLLVCILLAWNIRRGGIGRLLVALRDNEDAARAFTIPATRLKLIGFALAGFIAGLGGAAYSHSLSQVGQDAFPTATNISIVVMTVIGGVGLLSGPMLGSLIVLFIPDFLNLGNAGLAATSLGQLIIIMYLPGGLVNVVIPLRDRIARFLGRRAGIDVEAAFLEESSSGAASAPTAVRRTHAIVREAPRQPRFVAGEYLLEAQGLRKSFGGVRAVRGVSFGVRQGETLGLIGPNGAGKTTTFELLAGFTKSDEGMVKFAGKDVTTMSPEQRGQLGLIRSFQDAALFPTLTVTECVQLSLERVEPTRVGPALLGLSGQEKRKAQTARDLVAWMGLDRYRSAQIGELSTGTRRITEIACLVALQPRLLLLDEPSSGVAQKETEALGELLHKLRRQLSLTLIIIEHDIPLIMGISDRIVAMADGEVIAAGTPDIVRSNPRVVEAYLGGSITAIERSGGGVDELPAVADDATIEIGDLELLEELAAAGLGRARSAALVGTFGSYAALARATDVELCAVPGIGPSSVRRVRFVIEQFEAREGVLA